MIYNEIARDISEIIEYSSDKQTQLKLYNYLIDTLKEQDYKLYVKRARIYEDTQKYKRAIREYRLAINSLKATEIEGQISYAHHKISYLYYELGNYNKAIEEAKISVEINPDPIIFDCFDFTMTYNKYFAKRDLAELYYKTGDYNNALKIMNKIDRLYTSETVLLIKILIANKNYIKAKKQIDKLEETSNKYVLLAEIEKLKGNIKKAVAFYKKAKEVKRDFGEYGREYINKQLGNYYESIGNAKEAVKYYKEIYDETNNGIVLGDYYFKNKDYKNAIIYYLETLNHNNLNNRYHKDNTYLWYQLGQSYAALNDKKQAKICFEQVNWLEPDNKEYKELVEKYSTPEDIELKRKCRHILESMYGKRKVKDIIQNIIDILIEEYDEIPQEIEEYLEKLSGCANTNEMINEKWVSDIIHDFSVLLHKKFQFTKNKLTDYLKEIKNVPLRKILHQRF